MADVPRVLVRPPVPCCVWVVDRDPHFCLRPAVRARRFTEYTLPLFVCEFHALPDDPPIPDEALFRLVTVTLEVGLCGVSYTQSVAQSEAVGRLERAIEEAGGVINLHACRSTLARQVRPVPVGRQPAGRGREA